MCGSHGARGQPDSTSTFLLSPVRGFHVFSSGLLAVITEIAKYVSLLLSASRHWSREFHRDVLSGLQVHGRMDEPSGASGPGKPLSHLQLPQGPGSRWGSQSVYLTLSPAHRSSFLCVHVCPGRSSTGISNVLISFASCYCFLALPLKGLLSDLGCESQFTQEPLQNSVLSIGTAHEMKTVKQTSAQDSLRYSSLFSANKLIAFQT